MEMELVRVTKRALGGNTIQTVNARELYEFLESKQEFANWIKGRVEEYGYTEGEEFLTILSKTPSDAGGRPSREYFISLDMAKELAMVERTEKGRQARKYFIECERRLREMTSELRALPAPAGTAMQEGIQRGIGLMMAAGRYSLKVADLEKYFYFRKLGLDTAQAEAAFGMAPGAAAAFEQELGHAGIRIRPDRKGLEAVAGRLAEMVAGEEVSLKQLPVSDALSDFGGEICLLDRAAAIRTLVLYAKYRDWAIENHRYLLGFNDFRRELTSRFPVTKQSAYGKERRAHFLGITLKNPQPAGTIEEFVEKCCVLDPRASVLTRDLYIAFRNWCYSKGGGHIGRQLFFKSMESKYAGRIAVKKAARKMSFFGITLKGEGGERL